MNIQWIGSPNFTPGRGRAIDRIVLHWMAGTIGPTDFVFQDTIRQTSAHYGIEDGTIHQYVKESDTAWHAGDGDMNSRSIGIEHSASPDRPASAQTVETSAKLVAEICQRYKIPCDRQHIIKHSEVIATQCPGTIPIDDIIKKAKAIMEGEDVMDRRQVDNLFLGVLGRHVDESGLKTYLGKNWDKALTSLRNSSEFKKRQEALKNAKPSTDADKKLQQIKEIVNK